MTNEGQAQEIGWTATYENVGVEVRFSVPTPEAITIEMAVREVLPGAPWRGAHPLSRVTPSWFAGSVFGLRPGRAYDLKLRSDVFAEDRVLQVHTRAEPLNTAVAGATYHVSAEGGSDTNPGTSEGLPFASLGRALGVARAGNKIVLHAGVYHEGDLFVWRSGTAAQPIVLEAAEGDRPIVDGTVPDLVLDWELYESSNRLYRAPCQRQPDKAYLNGGHLFRYTRLDDLRHLRWDQPGGFFVDGSHVYVRFPDNSGPEGQTLSLPRYTTGITFEGQSYWQIRGITFRYFGAGAFHRALYLDGADHILVDRCEFRHNVIGIALKRAADYNTIQNNLFVETPISSWNWYAAKTGGVGYEGGGVVIYSSNQPNRGNVIRRNRFEDGFDGAHLYSANELGPTRDMDFYDNVVVNCLDDAVETDGAGVNNRIFRNTFQGFLTGVSVAPAALGPTYIVRNVFRGWRTVEDFTGYPVKFNVNSSLSTRFVYLYHNTCYTDFPNQDGFLFKNYSDWSEVVSRNNIYVGTDFALESHSSENPVDFDFDALYSIHESRRVSWRGTSFATLTEFAEATGQERRGVWGDPGFVNVAGGDLSLAPTSPLLDVGEPISGINDDFSGAAPDIGAFERTGP